jgi:hypothetical protein
MVSFEDHLIKDVLKIEINYISSIILNTNMSKKYEYLTGDAEFSERMGNGEDIVLLSLEISAKWAPGNEILWNEYNINTLVNTNVKRVLKANRELYERIQIYRELTKRGFDMKGKDPKKNEHLLKIED